VEIFCPLYTHVESEMILNEYETIYITRPDLSDDLQNAVHAKLTEIITNNGGELLVEEKWGRRKMAYSIQKHSYANYVLIDYVGPADLPVELERNINIDDRLIRHLTIRLGANVNVEVCKPEAEARHKSRQDKMNSDDHKPRR
jgi:small subunit ribosomal protein S6